jgi:hypothetical protein
MSKCEIKIEFDRSDRAYLGGETVSGHVRIRVNDDVQCSGIQLTHFWKTHGRGNTNSGDRYSQELAGSRRLLRGETLTFPFSFTAEREPVTYRGHYINIDHYVRVEVDVPWAFDPKAEEEFIVRPGKPPAALGGQPELAIKPKTNWTPYVVLTVVAAVIVVIAAAFVIILVPLLLIVALGFWIVKKLVASRLGEVVLLAPKVAVAPGESWPVELRFTPRKTFTVNAITVKIMGQEAATSGSGTDATTHRHTLFEETQTLHPSDTLMRGKPFYRQTAIALPQTDAFSFESPSNKIQWWAEIRVDMPGFPDWSQKQALQMIPREFVQGVSGGEPRVVAKWR